MKKTKKQIGGARAKAGRKPIEDKKVPLTIYVRQSVIERVGGKDEAKQIATDAVEGV
jgi:hypothetical protein